MECVGFNLMHSLIVYMHLVLPDLCVKSIWANEWIMRILSFISKRPQIDSHIHFISPFLIDGILIDFQMSSNLLAKHWIRWLMIVNMNENIIINERNKNTRNKNAYAQCAECTHAINSWHMIKMITNRRHTRFNIIHLHTTYELIRQINASNLFYRCVPVRVYDLVYLTHFDIVLTFISVQRTELNVAMCDSCLFGFMCVLW